MTHSIAADTHQTTLAIQGGAPVAEPPVPMISVSLSGADIDAALGVLRSGMLAAGKSVASFEERFAAMTGARHAVACANGTCALQLAYEPLFKPGDEVLAPAWTFIATASMIVARGATPIFCDAHPETYCLDVADAASRITSRTTAIAVTHLYGNVADIKAIEQLATEHGLRVIYDAAQAHLATYDQSGIGAFGDAVTYSFYPTKNMTTGEGGMVTTNDESLARRLRALRSHGETGKYTHEMIGYNYRMSEMEGAIGCSQLDRLAALTSRRRDIASRLDQAIEQIPGVSSPNVTPGAEHSYHLYAVRLDPDAFSCTRDEFVEALRAEGIGCAVHYPKALTQQPVFSSLKQAPTPVADRLAQTLLCVPSHPALSDQDVDHIAQALGKVATALRK